jgi:hypothetical protein
MLSSLRARGAAAVAVVALGASATAIAFSHHGASATAATPSTARGAPPSGGAGPAGGGYATDLKAAAAYLGLSTDELRTKLRSGTTLAALAKAEGRTTAGLVEAILAADRKGMSASQRAQSAATLRRRIEQLVTSSGPPAGAGRPPQGMAAAP